MTKEKFDKIAEKKRLCYLSFSREDPFEYFVVLTS